MSGKRKYHLRGMVFRSVSVSGSGGKRYLADFSRRGLVRLALMIIFSFFFFSRICRPAFINGGSMLPAYPERGFNFCWKPAFWFRSPRRGQVVIARYAGERLMLLKRVVALGGDTVEFRSGDLYVNGIKAEEPYVAGGCNWNLPLRRVDDGHVYLVGDNRSGPMENIGMVPVKRLAGRPLW